MNTSRRYNTNTIACPQCKSVTALGGGGVAALPSNYWAEQLQKDANMTAGLPEQYVNHCEEHGDTLSLFCEDCDQPVCRDCVLTAHSTHKYTSVVDARDLCAFRIEKQLDSTVRRAAADAERAILACATVRNLVAERTQQVIQEIDIFTEAQIEGLHIRRRELVQQATSLQQQKLAALDTQCAALSSDCTKLCSVAHFVDKAVRYSHGAELLSIRCMITDRMNECMANTTPVEPVEDASTYFVEPSKLTEAIRSAGVVHDRAGYAPNCFARGDGLSQAVCGEAAQFEVVSVDRSSVRRKEGGDVFLVRLMMVQSQSSHECSNETESSGSVVDCGDGRYIVSYRPRCVGPYQVAVRLRGEHISGSPFKIGVVAKSFPPGLRMADLGTGSDGTLIVTRTMVLSEISRQYVDVIVKQGGTLTCQRWGGDMQPGSSSIRGGKLELRCRGRVVVERGGVIDVSGCGYQGGVLIGASLSQVADQFTSSESYGQQGESLVGVGRGWRDANAGGGGGGASNPLFGSVGGGGGGYGSAGEDGTVLHSNGTEYDGGRGGQITGSSRLDPPLLGNGGGSGAGLSGAGVSRPGRGGAGGGILVIVCRDLVVHAGGAIRADGENGERGTSPMDSGGGGGSGGSILICAGEMHASTGSVVSARGGRGGPPGHAEPQYDATVSPVFSTAGGRGGAGRIHALIAAGGFQGDVWPQPLLTHAPQPRMVGSWPRQQHAVLASSPAMMNAELPARSKLKISTTSTAAAFTGSQSTGALE